MSHVFIHLVEFQVVQVPVERVAPQQFLVDARGGDAALVQQIQHVAGAGASLAASVIFGSVYAGSPQPVLLATVSWNTRLCWSTVAICARSESSVTQRRLCLSMRISPEVGSSSRGIR